MWCTPPKQILIFVVYTTREDFVSGGVDTLARSLTDWMEFWNIEVDMAGVRQLATSWNSWAMVHLGSHLGRLEGCTQRPRSWAETFEDGHPDIGRQLAELLHIAQQLLGLLLDGVQGRELVLDLPQGVRAHAASGLLPVPKPGRADCYWPPEADRQRFKVSPSYLLQSLTSQAFACSRS